MPLSISLLIPAIATLFEFSYISATLLEASYISTTQSGIATLLEASYISATLSGIATLFESPYLSAVIPAVIGIVAYMIPGLVILMAVVMYGEKKDTLVLASGIFAVGCLLYAGYIKFLSWLTGYQINMQTNLNGKNIIIALGFLLALILVGKFFFPIFEVGYFQSFIKLLEAFKPLVDAGNLGRSYVIIVGPFMEEVFFRDFLIPLLTKPTNTILAVVLSSLVFAILHANLLQSSFAFVAGVLLGSLYVLTGSLLLCIIVHMTYNAWSTAFYIEPKVAQHIPDSPPLPES